MTELEKKEKSYSEYFNHYVSEFYLSLDKNSNIYIIAVALLFIFVGLMVLRTTLPDNKFALRNFANNTKFRESKYVYSPAMSAFAEKVLGNKLYTEIFVIRRKDLTSLETTNRKINGDLKLYGFSIFDKSMLYISYLVKCLGIGLYITASWTFYFAMISFAAFLFNRLFTSGGSEVLLDNGGGCGTHWFRSAQDLIGSWVNNTNTFQQDWNNDDKNNQIWFYLDNKGIVLNVLMWPLAVILLIYDSCFGFMRINGNVDNYISFDFLLYLINPIFWLCVIAFVVGFIPQLLLGLGMMIQDIKEGNFSTFNGGYITPYQCLKTPADLVRPFVGEGARDVPNTYQFFSINRWHSKKTAQEYATEHATNVGQAIQNEWENYTQDGYERFWYLVFIIVIFFYLSSLLLRFISYVLYHYTVGYKRSKIKEYYFGVKEEIKKEIKKETKAVKKEIKETKAVAKKAVKTVTKK